MLHNETHSQSLWRRLTVPVLGISLCIALAGQVSTQGGQSETGAKIDDAALAKMLQSFDKVEKEEHPWGWLRWLMNAKLDPQSKMTLGLVQINVEGSNPMHVHPNCEEVLYMLSGSCEHRIGDRTVTLNKGDVLRIPTGVPHAARALGDEPVRAVICYSSGDRQFEVVEGGEY